MNAVPDDEARARIAARLEELDAEDALGREGQGVVTLDQQSVGRLSRMDALQSQAMAKAGQARRDAERRRLAQALERLDDGEYGYCDTCGEEIAPKRLALDPTATRCVECAAG
ncbi:RNA polymerase-binding transcription factor DksA [Roseivivax jejudonensis]|uniref:RNA polymerase-binding transcription factor DksA n=1 Tax=Roseivivax jejudonensis TaxID=1529041 RepID=A0A1X6ZFT7_9RHOB|nr:TraR/DksA C4-type zinc finger protein [Roseivivax jejudonensis]SLN50480.1 RNA polymerase-binding transcription factor DksA [Roseivivax jejudonensis]